MSYDTYKPQAKPAEVGRHDGGAKARSLAMVWSVSESRRSEERLPKAAQRVNAVNQFTGLMVPFFLCVRGQFRWLGRLSYAATGIL
jgi:hypothetical protein